MSVPHLVVFLDPSLTLSNELGLIQRRFQATEVVAPVPSKGARGQLPAAADLALGAIRRKLEQHASQARPARLSVWLYEPSSPADVDAVWAAFGRSAWVEFVPRTYRHKDRPTRLYIEGRIDAVLDLVHPVSTEVVGGRKTSPFSLSLTNFRSRTTIELSAFWYRGADRQELERRIKRITQRFKQEHTKPNRVHIDDRALSFDPAVDTECHGIAHPTGASARAFVNGRFRFGAALFPGFHYDVEPTRGQLLDCVLYDSEGRPRNLRPEKRKYINVFPNDHLLPEL